jgi:Fibronectin type III domain
MSQHVRVADRFMRLSAEQLITMAGAVITGLTGNPAFPSPTVDLKAVQTAVDDLNAALAAQAHGGTAATAEKNNKQEALIGLMRKLKHYVEDNCGNDPAVLMSSGFQAAVSTRTRSPLANPSILDISRGNSVELVLRVTPIAHAKCYEVRSAAVGAGNAPGPWETAGLFTNSRSMSITGLTPGTTYVFQVRAVGGSTGYSDWSNPVSQMCA